MKADKFKVGNFIYDPECEPYYFQIEEIRKFEDHNLWAVYRKGSIKTINPEPVIITGGHLDRFGFRRHITYTVSDDFGISNTKEVIDYRLNGFTVTFKSNKFVLSVDGTLSPIYVEYLHQIQNLYEMFRDEELTIKTDNA